MTPEEREAFDRLKEAIHCNPRKYVPAARIIRNSFSINKEDIKDGQEKVAFGIVNRFVNNLLKYGNYECVAGMLWTPSIITVEPYAVREIWGHIRDNQQAFIIGPGGVGKSRSAAAWLLCDWSADPHWTFIKLLSVTKEHAEKNIFAHVKNLHRDSAIPLPGEILANSIRIGNRENSGFQLTTIAQGDNGKGRLRGCHPDPRPEPHPVHGTHSRIRIGLDEAELIGDGAFGDIGNLLITEGADTDHMKIIALTNPVNRDTPFGEMCEPSEGFQAQDPETAHKWNGRNGIKVLRIDGGKTENVVQRRVVFPGFMTYDGYSRLAAKGLHDSEFWSMGKGYWPPSSSASSFILPEATFDAAMPVGTVIFTGIPVNIGAFDTALEGGDNATLSIGRYGYAVGFKPQSGAILRYPKPCKVGIIEYQMVLPKQDSVKMAEDVMRRLKQFNVAPENTGIDRTGNGAGVHDYMLNYWAPSVIGVNYSEVATEKKILAEDLLPANLIYRNLNTELGFAFCRWIQHGWLKFSPSIIMSGLREEITKRKYAIINKLMQIQSKQDFKASIKRSPDAFDSGAIFTHVCRTIDTSEASQKKPEEEKAGNRNKKPLSSGLSHGITDIASEFVDMTE